MVLAAAEADVYGGPHVYSLLALELRESDADEELPEKLRRLPPALQSELLSGYVGHDVLYGANYPVGDALDHLLGRALVVDASVRASAASFTAHKCVRLID